MATIHTDSRRYDPRRIRHASTERLRKATAFALALALLAGCVSTGSQPYPYVERISIEALPPAQLDEEKAIAGTGKLVAGGAAGGAAGVLVAGLATSVICGPFFAVCFAGTGAAALGGAAAGAVLAGSTALSEEDAERAIQRLESLQGSRDLNQALSTAVVARLPAARIAPPQAADARLSLGVQGLQLATGFDDTVALGVIVEARLARGPDWERQTTRHFRCQSDLVPLEKWLDTARPLGDRGLTRCIDQLAEKIETALQEQPEGTFENPASATGFGQYDPSTAEW